MTYFLGRDVELYLTTESDLCSGSSDSDEQVLMLNSEKIALQDLSTHSTQKIVPPMLDDATVRKGVIKDITGIDLSIGVSDEDVGPFLGKPQIMQKVELRKETVVTVTRKKDDEFYDTLFNGPSTAADFFGSATDATRQGARFGVVYDGNNCKINDGSQFMGDVVESGTTADCVYGFRLHIVLKSTISGELFTVRNATMTGHTVTLNADGTQEETLEFTSSVAPGIERPSNISGDTTGFNRTSTPVAEL